ncbi:MAG TPA: FAD-dependent oxidoreductase, partial [Bacteroidales bacterium]
MKKVIVIGGGVAGMSAAHELVERGFEVEVYEKQPRYVGGKARSVDVPQTATGGRKPLPGEHGFRFFPGFYQHVTDTMKRIPFKGNENGVFDNLVSTERVAMGREGMNEIITLVNFPKSKKDLQVMLYALKNSHTGITDADVNSMVNKVWQLMTSCKERRLNEYERIGWWQFTNADFHSEAYREFFVGGLTRTLVAAKPREVSTRTGGDILLQLIYQMATPGKRTDRVLNGPTNEAWLDPWYNYLTKDRKGGKVKFFHGHTVNKLHCRTSVLDTWDIIGADFVDEKGNKKTVTGDYYIMAVPVEVAAKVIENSENIVTADPVLGTISDLAKDVSWMTGIQYYLNVDIPITKGHVMIIDSPWAVTVISQPQFWKKINLSDYGNGEVKGIISVDISDWNSVGFNGKCARECTKAEIAQEVWCQIVLGLLVDGKPIFNKDMLMACFLDRDIRQADGSDPSAKDNDIDVSKITDCNPELIKTLPDKYAKNPPVH